MFGIEKKPRRALIALVILSACLLLACAAQSSVPVAQQAPEQAAQLTLPLPSDIPRLASAPPAEADLFHRADNYDGSLPSNKVMDKIGEIDLTPDWNPPSQVGPGFLSYIGFRFTNLSEYTGPEIIRLNWKTAPPDYQYLWLAVADFATDGWRWYPVPTTDRVDLAAFGDCLSGADELIALVLLSGTEDATLDWILLGERLAPTAWLTSDVNPDPSCNVAPLTVNFSGLGSGVIGGEITAWDFDFDDDGTYEVLGDTTGEVQHVYTTPGDTTCRLRVHDDIDATDEATQNFWVIDPANTPPTASFTATPNNGSAPLFVDLDATGTTDDTGIRRYEWDLDDDGVYETDSAISPIYGYTFGTNGTNNVHLRVTDLDYATDVQTEVVTVQHGFAHATVATGYIINTQMAAGICNTGVNQRACVTWQDFSNQDLKFACATNAEGSNYALAADPVDASGDVGYSPSMIFNNGYPLIAYGRYGGDSKFDLELVRATALNGGSWTGPTVVDSDTGTGGLNALAPIYGMPAIASISNCGNSGSTDVYYYRAAAADGSSWNPGIKVLDGPADGMLTAVDMLGSFISFYQVPVIAYAGRHGHQPQINEAYVIRAEDMDGGTWLTPTTFSDRRCQTLSLLIANGFPALAGGSPAQNGCLYYGRAGEAAGDTWPAGLAELKPGGHGGFCDLQLVNGNPAMCYFSFAGGNLWYVEAADANGDSWNDPYIVASSGTVGEYCAMTVLDGGTTPVIFYYDNDNDNVMAAYWVP